MAQHAARSTKPQASGFLAGRGVLLVLLAVAVGVLLLARAVGPDDEVTAVERDPATTIGPEDGGGDTSTSAPASTEPAVTTIAPAGDPASVVVLVANARGVAGAAGANTEALKVLNYNVLDATDHPTTEEATHVYFAPDHQADAVGVADALGIAQSAVAPFPPDGVPVELGGAVVLVVLGTDGQGVNAG